MLETLSLSVVLPVSIRLQLFGYLWNRKQTVRILKTCNLHDHHQVYRCSPRNAVRWARRTSSPSASTPAGQDGLKIEQVKAGLWWSQNKVSADRRGILVGGSEQPAKLHRPSWRQVVFGREMWPGVSSSFLAIGNFRRKPTGHDILTSSPGHQFFQREGGSVMRSSFRQDPQGVSYCDVVLNILLMLSTVLRKGKGILKLFNAIDCLTI